MIRIVEGDLLEAKEDIIGHQVNCQGKMNSGVAKAIRGKYPYVYEEYMNFFHMHEDKRNLLGECDLVHIGVNKMVANLFGQFNYGYDGGSYTDVDALKMALTILKDVAKAFNASVALPYKIGCVRGGADWDTVYSLIEEIFSDYEVTLYRLG